MPPEEIITPPPGDKGVFRTAGGHLLFARKCAKEGDIGGARPEVDRGDPRVLPIALESGMRRYVEPRSILEKLGESRSVDWPILAPKTTLWLMRFMIMRRGSCGGYHDRWVAETKLDSTPAGVQEHGGLYRVLDIALIYDGLGITRLASFEVVSWRLQMIHDKWKHKLPNVVPSSGDAQDDAH